MRFEKLVLHRFGHFTDFTLDFGSPPTGTPDLHVIYGANEAGKSTTLAAITDLLYGIERVTPWSFLHANNLLELEAVLQQSQQRVGLKRFKNHLANSAGDRLERFPLDLQGLSRDDYTRRFSFDEQTLQDGGEQILHSHGDVGQALFSASAGLANLKTMMELAMSESNAFYLPNRRKNLQLTELKSTLLTIRQEMDTLKLDVRTWNKRVDTLARADHQRQEHRQQRDGLLDAIRQLERRQSMRTIALRYQTLVTDRQALEARGVISMDNPRASEFASAQRARESVERIRQQIEHNRTVTGAQAERSAQLGQLKKQLIALQPDSRTRSVLDSAERISQLSEEASAAYEWRQQQLDCQSTVEQCDAAIATMQARLQLAPDKSVESILPGVTLLAELNSLLDEETGVSARLTHAQEELHNLDPLPEDTPEVPDAPEEASAMTLAYDVLRRIQHEGLPQQRTLAQESLLSTRKRVQDMARRLDLGEADLDRLKLPDSAWLGSRLNTLGEYRHRASQLADSIETLGSELQDKQSACRQLSLKGAVDQSTILASRQSRDRAWQAHTAALSAEHPYAELQTSARAFDERQHQHDSLLDSALSSSQESAELQILQSQLATQAATLASLRDEQAVRLAEQLDELDARIRGRVEGFYRATEIDIDELRERFADAVKLKDLQLDCAAQVLAVKHLEQRCLEQVQQLLAALARAGTPLPDADPAGIALEDLSAFAQRSLDEQKDRLAQRREQLRACQSHASELQRRRDNLARAEQALADWQTQWRQRIQNTLFEGMTLTQVRDALPWIGSIRPRLDERRKATLQLETLANRLATREHAVAQLLAELELPSLTECSKQLHLAVLQRDEHVRVQRQLDSLEKEIAVNKAAHAESLSSIDTLRGDLEVSSDEQLLALLNRTEEHRTLCERCTETLQQLTEISGEPIHEAQVARLIEQSDPDSVSQQLLELNSRHVEASAAYDEANQAWALANKAVQESHDSDRYRQLVQRRSDLLADIADRARRCAEARCGQLVLNAAMVKFRQEHQSVILSEAQSAFTTLTGGRYVQLVPRDDGRGNERLYAIDQHQNARAVSHLSTGTRYQLYLALRAAAHADYAMQRQPLPFVADDIMESFDDDRSAAAFKVLGNMANKGQVVYLTHHRHLLDIAQDVLGVQSVHIHHFHAGADQYAGPGLRRIPGA
ncbi:MAG: AAA family ATPase [Granulosicoccus sp.]|nr:AAA family ATPase [Granulosicoccus sp.]